ncbi:MAG: Crp/Fnr family transcriptional regulator [Sphingobacterium siyangense]
MENLLSDLIKLTTGVNDEQLKKILPMFRSAVVKKNEHLLEHGMVADRLFFICKGCLRLYYQNEDRANATRFMAFENTFLTSIVSFISREPTTEYIQAVENAEVFYITHKDFLFIRNEIPAWDRLYIYILEYGLTVVNRKLSSLLTQNATERYRSLLLNNPDLIQRLSNANLAAYLNISPETLSRLKSNI